VRAEDALIPLARRRFEVCRAGEPTLRPLPRGYLRARRVALGELGELAGGAGVVGGQVRALREVVAGLVVASRRAVLLAGQLSGAQPGSLVGMVGRGEPPRVPV
jgi:hypothetical protein